MAGDLVIRKGGFLGIEDSSDDDMADDRGKAQVFTDKPDDCCCCDPCENSDPKPYKIIHSWTSNRNDSRRTEDLRPYQKKGECFKYWRLFEGNYSMKSDGCHESNGTQYGSGSIVNGELVGLPDSFTSNYSYDGAMKILVHCC